MWTPHEKRTVTVNRTAMCWFKTSKNIHSTGFKDVHWALDLYLFLTRTLNPPQNSCTKPVQQKVVEQHKIMFFTKGKRLSQSSVLMQHGVHWLSGLISKVIIAQYQNRRRERLMTQLPTQNSLPGTSLFYTLTFLKMRELKIHKLALLHYSFHTKSSSYRKEILPFLPLTVSEEFFNDTLHTASLPAPSSGLLQKPASKLEAHNSFSLEPPAFHCQHQKEQDLMWILDQTTVISLPQQHCDMIRLKL